MKVLIFSFLKPRSSNLTWQCWCLVVVPDGVLKSLTVMVLQQAVRLLESYIACLCHSECDPLLSQVRKF